MGLVVLLSGCIRAENDDSISNRLASSARLDRLSRSLQTRVPASLFVSSLSWLHPVRDDESHRHRDSLLLACLRLPVYFEWRSARQLVAQETVRPNTFVTGFECVAAAGVDGW